MSKSETSTGRSLKRLVLRLVYCAKFDARWYVKSPYGVRRHVDDVATYGVRIVSSVSLLMAALAVLLLRPLVAPLHWLWHSTVNAERIEEMMSKSENAKLSDGGEVQNG